MTFQKSHTWSEICKIPNSKARKNVWQLEIILEYFLNESEERIKIWQLVRVGVEMPEDDYKRGEGKPDERKSGKGKGFEELGYGRNIVKLGGI